MCSVQNCSRAIPVERVGTSALMDNFKFNRHNAVYIINFPQTEPFVFLDDFSFLVFKAENQTVIDKR